MIWGGGGSTARTQRLWVSLLAPALFQASVFALGSLGGGIAPPFLRGWQQGLDVSQLCFPGTAAEEAVAQLVSTGVQTQSFSPFFVPSSLYMFLLYVIAIITCLSPGESQLFAFPSFVLAGRAIEMR